MTSHITWEHNFEAFHLAPYTSYHLIFLKHYISLWDRCLKFLIFQFDELAFGLFGHHTFYIKSLSLLPSQMLVCSTGFCSSLSLFILRFTLVELFKEKRKKEKKRVGRYIGTSLCMSQDQQNHWLIIRGKFEDLFTTVTKMSRFLPQRYECIWNKLHS